MMSTDDRAPCPYVGLQPFQESDREFFFGRERAQRVIISNLLASPLTILYGSSGVGKSSVLMAGVVPQLRRDRPRNPVIVFRTWVGEDFQLALTRACIEEVWRNDVGQPKPAETLPLDEILRACGEAAHETILVLFDQFEEYFLYHAKSADPASFEAQFARAVNREDVDIGFLIALREDGLSKLDRFQERIPGLLSNRLRLKHLDETGAAAAIRSPLDVWNSQYAVGQPSVTIEDDLVAQLIEQVKIGRVAVGRQGGSGATQQTEQFIEAPFLQLVMTRLWKAEMASGSRLLRLATLVRLKGAKEIVRTHLDDVMADLDATSQAVCASFFDRLVTPTGSKVACTRDDLANWAGKLAPQVPAVLQTLSHNAILRTVAASPDNPDATSYEIFHDVLAPAIVDWRLRYVEGQQRALAVREAREQAAKRAVRKWLAALAAMTAIAVAGWVYASWERLRAEANQKAAESIATSPSDAKRGLDLALAAADRTSRFGLSPTVSAEDALDQAIQASTLEWSLRRAGRVWAVAFSPDGRRLAVGDGDKTVTIWEIVAGEPRWSEARTFSVPESVRAVVFLPPGDRLATAGGDTARLWQVGTAAESVQFKQGSEMEAALAVSPDGKRLATAGNGKDDRTIKVWDTETGAPEPIATIDMAGAWVKGLAFSPDGCCLATANVEQGSTSRTFSEVWNVNSGTRILRVPNPVPSDAVAFTPDGKSLVTAGRDGRVRVWRPAVDALDEVLADRSATAADTSRAATAAETVPLLPMPLEPPDIPWNVRVLVGHLERVRNLAVSRDGSRIASASADHSVILWDAETGEHLRTLAGHENFVEAVAFSADGQQLATGGRDKTLKMWNIAGHGAGVYSIAFSPDGATLATASGEHTTKLWDLSSGVPRWRHTLQGHSEKVYRLAFDPTGGRLVTASFDNTAKLWDVASGALLRTLTGHKDQLRNVAYSPDGKRIATVSADGTALLYRLDVPNLDAVPTRVTHNAEIPDTQASAVAFHPSRPLWVTGGWDGTLQLWDFDGKHLGTIAHPEAGGANSLIVDVAFSRDGAEIAALAMDGIYFWSIAAPGQAKPRTIAIPYCDSFEYSPDGTQLAVACSDGGVRIYDPTTGTLLKTVTVHNAPVTDAAFSPDGKRLATASLDKTFHISPVRFDELYKVAKRLQAAMSDEK